MTRKTSTKIGTKNGAGPTASSLGDVFSAREAYGWISDGFPGNGERVGTYPFFGHWPDREYRYVICQDGFPGPSAGDPVGKRGIWEELIKGAFGQWEEATDGFVRMTHVDTRDCPNNPFDTFVRDYDDKYSEVRMLDPDAVRGSDVWLIPEIKSDLFKICISEGSACVTSFSGYAPLLSTDPLVRETLAGLLKKHKDGTLSFEERERLLTAYLKVASGRREATNELMTVDVTFRKSSFDVNPLKPNTDPLNRPDKISFNTCFMGNTSHLDDQGFYAYSIAVHEAGHALGLSNVYVFPPGDAISEQPYDAAHPTIPDSVMNYDGEKVVGVDTTREPDCSPYPFDLMAIYALYQTHDITPSAPRNLRATATHDTVHLDWLTPVKGEIREYYIQRREFRPFTTSQLEYFFTGSRLTSFIDTDVKAETRYLYSLQAVDRKGLTYGGWSGEIEVQTGPAP